MCQVPGSNQLYSVEMSCLSICHLKQVILKRDVSYVGKWSMACIMTEICYFLLNKKGKSNIKFLLNNELCICTE